METMKDASSELVLPKSFIKAGTPGAKIVEPNDLELPWLAGKRERQHNTYVTNVIYATRPIVHHFRAGDQFIGFCGSSAESQSTTSGVAVSSTTAVAGASLFSSSVAVIGREFGREFGSSIV